MMNGNALREIDPEELAYMTETERAEWDDPQVGANTQIERLVGVLRECEGHISWAPSDEFSRSMLRKIRRALAEMGESDVD